MSNPIRTIIAGVVDTEDPDPVLQQAVALAERLGATLHLVHAYTPPDAVLALGLPPLELPGVGVPAVELDRGAVEAAIGARLRDQVSKARAAPPLRLHVEAGAAPTVLVRVAEDTAADLVLVGATRRGALGRAILGTTAGRLLREVSAPTLVLRQPLPASGARILLATDLTELSATACARGIEMSRHLFSSGPLDLRCLHALGPMPDIPQPDVALEEAARRDQLRDLVARLPAERDHVEPVLRPGAPAAEVVAYAGAWPADLVVLGTHARSGIPRLLLGSVAEPVVRDVPCNALVIPPTVTHQE